MHEWHLKYIMLTLSLATIGLLFATLKETKLDLIQIYNWSQVLGVFDIVSLVVAIYYLSNCEFGK